MKSYEAVEYHHRGVKNLANSVLSLCVVDALRKKVSSHTLYQDIIDARYSMTHKTKSIEFWCDVANISIDDWISLGKKLEANGWKHDLGDYRFGTSLNSISREIKKIRSNNYDLFEDAA